MPPSLAAALAAVGVLLSLASFGFAVSTARDKRTADLADRLARLETKVEVFWRQVSFDAAMTLHSPEPEHARRDHLIEGFVAGTLTGAELRELVRDLNRLIEDETAIAGKRLAASIVVNAIQQRFVEFGD